MTGSHSRAQQHSLAHQLERASRSIAARCGAHAPGIAVVLGSGLGGFADTLQDSRRIAFHEVEGMPAAAIAGHSGQFVFGRHHGAALCAMQGRVHLYEGHAPERVVFGVRLMIALGARTLILTNAAGGLREDLRAGDLMVIDDHLNLTGQNPLAGPNDDALGPRFLQLSDAYDPALRALAQRVARTQGTALAGGVYAGLLGPSYETPAEVRMLRALGADAVGMSTVLEVIAARHMGARVLGLSCITNRAGGEGEAPPDHAEVQRVARAAQGRFSALLAGVIAALAEEAVT